MPNTCKDPRRMRIALIGPGGVGGYLAAHLLCADSELTLVARGERGRVLAEQGLHLISLTEGEQVLPVSRIEPSAALLPPQDLILLCVKNYSLEEVLPQLSTAVTEDTVILPVMNGIDPADRIKAFFPQATVLKSLIYIIAYTDEAFRVHHTGKETKLLVGLKDASEKEARLLEETVRLLSDCGIPACIAGDIDLEIWKKYVLNCGYNVCTAYYRAPIGQLRSNPASVSDYKALIHEALQTGIAAGIPLEKSHADFCIDRFLHYYPPTATSSLQRDIMASRPAEIDTFCGALLRKAASLGLSLPVTQRIWEELRLYRPQS